MSLDVSFVPGMIYRRSDLNKKFGGQQQGGITTPSKYPVIFLFDTPKGGNYGYDDGWTSDNVFRWVGEGQTGDQKLIRGNKAIAEHIQENEDIHLFKQVSSGRYRYEGQMICIGYDVEQGPDRDGNTRTVFVFNLSRAETYTDTSIPEEPDWITPIDSLRNKALAASTKSPKTRQQQAHETYQRSKAIRDYAIRRANGTCEACGNKAPFITTQNRPYLEVHHIKRLTDGGPDHPEWVAAICPNCHREAHYSKDKKTFNKQLLNTIKQKES
ncbi:MAG: HNH endonuclease [Candidatus Hodarchaeales archaeon]